MFVDIEKYPKNRVFYVKITTDLNETEDKLVCKYGDPEVQVGGTFTDGSFTFTLPEDIKKLKAGFKCFKQGFDGRELGVVEAKNRGTLYETVMKERLNQTLLNLKAIGDDYTSHEKVTL